MKEAVFIPFKPGLITPHHITTIGNAIWMFLWLIDKTTTEKEMDGDTCGIVYYGRPVSVRKMATDLACSERACRAYLIRLEKARYIDVTRTKAGPIIYVRKSIKWKWRSQNGQNRSRRTSAIAQPPAKRLQPSEVDWEAEARRGL